MNYSFQIYIIHFFECPTYFFFLKHAIAYILLIAINAFLDRKIVHTICSTSFIFVVLNDLKIKAY